MATATHNNGGPINRAAGPAARTPALGRTLDEQRFSGVPPVNETRFLKGELVVQISNTGADGDRPARSRQGLGRIR